jgi:phage tail-like protein
MSSKNRFLVEIDGIAQISATKVDGLEAIKHTPSKLMVGNRGNAILGRGNHEFGEVTVNVAEAYQQTALEVFEWHRSYAKGENVEPRGARVIQMDDDGSTPIATYELQGCVPTSFKNDGLDAGSNDNSMFTFAFQPEDCVRL